MKTTRSRWRAGWLVGVAALGIGLAAVPAGAQAPRRTERFTPDESFEARRLLRIAAEQVQNGQATEAIKLYQRVIKEFGNAVTPVAEADAAGPTTLYVDARQNCHQQIAKLPPEIRALYRRQVDPQAERWFREGLAASDPTRLRRVVEESFCSSFGDDALDALGDLAFRAGRFAEALGYYRQLVPDVEAGPGLLLHPDPSVDLARVAAKKLLARAAQGEQSPTKDDLDLFDQQYAKAEGSLAGRTGSLVESLRRALEQDRLAPPVALDGGWGTFAGAPSRDRIIPTAVDVGSLQWKVPLTPIGARLGATNYSRYTMPLPARQDRGLAYFPIIAGEQVVVCDADRLFAYNLADRPAMDAGSENTAKKVAWYQSPYPSGAPSAARQAQLPRYTVTAQGDRIFARLGVHRGGPSYLLAVRNNQEFEGKLIWMVTAGEIELSRQGGANGAVQGRFPAFEGTPVADSRNVYVALTETGGNISEVWVVCLDAETHATRWTRHLGEASVLAEQTMMGMPIGEEVGNRLLTLGGGTLYYQTNLGAIAALDAETGAIRWLATYPHKPDARSGVGRDLNPAIVHEGIVVAAPDDTSEILGFDAASGRLLWHTPVGEGGQAGITHLLGVAHGRLIATGNMVWTFDVKTGKLLSRWPESGTGYQGFGRGLLAGNYIYWPTKSEIIVLDQATGRKADRESIALQQVFNVTGGNLAMGGGYLVVATEDALVVFCENSRLIDRYKQLIVAAPHEASHYVRLARVAEATGQNQLALESLSKALEVARPAELLDGQPLVDLAAQQRYRLLSRLGADALAGKKWVEAARRYEEAAEAARSDRDRLSARLLRAEALEQSGDGRSAVQLLQGLLSEERLRGLAISADDRRTVRADLLIADRLSGLLKRGGRGLYAEFDATARRLYEDGIARKDPRLLEEIGKSYPVASVLPEALLALGSLRESTGEPAEAARAYKRLQAVAPDRSARVKALLGLARSYEAQGYWVPARDAYVRAQARFGDLELGDSHETVGAYVAERLARPPFDAMTGDRSEPTLPLPLARQWASHWPSAARPLAAEGVPPSSGSGRIFLAEGSTIRPIDPSSGRQAWKANLGGEPIWVAYLADRVLAATSSRLVALDLKTGSERWFFDTGDPRPARRVANPFARPPATTPDVPPARLDGFRLVGGRVFCRRGDRELLAIDGETGQIDWSFSPAGKGTLNPRFWIGPRQTVLQVRSPNAVVILESTTGIPRAEFPQSDQDDAWARDPMPIDEDRVAIVTDPRTVVLFDLDRGVAAWTYREPSALPRSGPPRLLGDSGRLLVLRDGSELVRLDPQNGKKVWSRIVAIEDLSEWPDAFALDGDHVYVATGRTLFAYDLGTGEPIWRRLLMGPQTGWCLTLSDRSLVAYPSPARSLEDGLTTLPVVLLSRKSGAIVQRLQFAGPITALSVRLAPRSILVATQDHGWALAPPAAVDETHPLR